MMPTTNPTTNRAIRAILLLLGLILHAGIAKAQSYTISPPPFLTALNNAGSIVSGACIWTYSAGTTTPATTYADTIGTQNANPIKADSAGRFTAYLLAGSNYKFVYETSCTSPSHGTVLRTADNISGTPASSATVDVTGTAGETISAGQCAYLSDGSGSKTAGQWFKCDSGQIYSSVLPEVGIAPSAIVSAASGTIRIAGSVTGLSSLSVGSTYYAGSAGAITTTSPTLSRNLGVADSASSIVLTPNPPRLPGPWMDDFRLTLGSGVPVTTSDMTAATTLFASPYLGNRIDLPDSSGNPVRHTSAEFSIAVPATTSQMYDVFAFSSSGVATLELLAWTNDTTRATAITRTNGRYFKSGDATRLYLGSFRTTAVSGQTEDSLAKRLVWNYYNRVRRPLSVLETTDTWTYTTATYRQANAASANQVAIVQGVAESPIDLRLAGEASNTGTAAAAYVAIGEDSTSAGVSGQLLAPMSMGVAGAVYVSMALLSKVPAVGYHFYAWLERSIASGTTTWYGDNGSSTLQQAGLIGWIEG